MSESKTQGIAAHEPGSVRDGTAALEARDGGTTPQDAIEQGQKDAKANHKAEQQDLGDQGPTREEIIEDAQETAELNHEVDTASQPEAGKGELKNDTSGAAKFRTAKSQLNPTGEETPSDAEIKRTAKADMTTGNHTGVSNEEAAERAANPGAVEEAAPLATTNPDADRSLDKDVAQNPNKNQSVSNS